MLVVILFYLAQLAVGISVFPLASRLFRSFQDRGWLFSKVLGLFISGWIFWILNSARILPFWRSFVLLLILVIFLVNLFFVLKSSAFRSGLCPFPLRRILAEEAVFLLVFVFFVFLIGFKPDVNSTEKFMDYAFFAAIRRNDYMPFLDPWFANEPVNYYYGGQYFSAFLVRAAGIADAYGYNLIRAFVASVSFSYPAVLVHQMLRDRFSSDVTRRTSAFCVFGGALSGCAAALCGNGHFVLYGFLKPLLARLRGVAAEAYWFSNSTRYIGYDPSTGDKTIHEFPAYSTVLGDLHAHYIDLIFVLLLLALLYACAKRQDEEGGLFRLRLDGRSGERSFGCLPHLIFIGLLTGIFRFTNYWDFPIYLVVAAAVLFIAEWKGAKRFLRALGNSAIALLLIVGIGILAALPFTLRFDMIASQIRLVTMRTMPYQFLILWGVPILVTVCFFGLLLREFRKRQKRGGDGPAFFRLLSYTKTADLMILTFGAAAIGLIFLPEIVYVRDIYEDGFARANTMFKLTYQGFLLFAILLGYAAVRFLYRKKRWRIAGVLVTAWILLTLGYFPVAVHTWFGDITDGSRWKGLDAEAFLATAYADDLGAIRYLQGLPGTPVILEAVSESYGTGARISAMTGLPAVIGWQTHEWLWRGDWDPIGIRVADVNSIYTSKDPGLAESLIRKYGIGYVVIGSEEKKRYGDLAEAALWELGTVVYEDEGAAVLKM